MTIINHLRKTMLFIAWIPLLQVWSQPLNLVVRDTTITAAATFVARNSITIGPDFRIGATGDVTMKTSGSVYMKPGIKVAQSGKLRSISDASIAVDVQTPQASLPAHFTLRQNYPNPFNPSTTISFSLPTGSFVSLKVFDALGREVSSLLSEVLFAGNYSRQWNASGLTSGIYFYRLQAGSFTETKKLVLLR